MKWSNEAWRSAIGSVRYVFPGGAGFSNEMLRTAAGARRSTPNTGAATRSDAVKSAFGMWRATIMSMVSSATASKLYADRSTPLPDSSA